MASPAFVVVGLSGVGSLESASHGAGRVMSRTQARATFAWGNVRRELEAKGVEVLSAGIDEVPGVYKDIHAVMARQRDLVEAIARFDPVLVKMAPAGGGADSDGIHMNRLGPARQRACRCSLTSRLPAAAAASAKVVEWSPAHARTR